MKKFISLILICVVMAGCHNQTSPEPSSTEYLCFEAEQPTLSATEPSDPDAILSYRRDLVEAEMRRAMSILWTPSEDIAYSLYSGSMGPEIDKQIVPDRVIEMKSGRIYRGVPYTHGSGSAYSFLDYATALNEKGIYTISNLSGESLTGYPDAGPWSQSRIGSDCVDTLFWAWSKVSTSISFTGTGEMTKIYGCIPVGNYVCDLPKLTDSTKPVVQANGENVMYQAYSQLQKGDGIVLYTKGSGGHAVMISDISLSYQGEVIDPENSYVTIIEHKSEPQLTEQTYYDEQLQETVYICGAVDETWTFSTLYGKGYLPVTCKELIDPSPVAEESVSISQNVTDITGLFQSAITATYRIASATVTIRQDNRIVQQATCFGRQDNNRQLDMSRFLDTVEQAVILGAIDPQALDAGDYECTVTCRLSTGNIHTVTDFEFTK